MGNSVVKEQEVSRLNQKFKDAKAVVFADYRGLSALEMTDLRSRLRKEAVEMIVVKNTLAKIASAGTPVEVGVKHFVGPTSVALSYTEQTAPAKVLNEYSKVSDKLKVTGGVVDGKALTTADVKVLADLPSREVLLSMALSTMNAPATNLVGVFAGVLRKLLYALKEIEQKKS